MCARRLRHSVRAMVSGGYQLLTTGQRARLCVCAPEGYDGSSAAGNLPARRARSRMAFDLPKKVKEPPLHLVRTLRPMLEWTKVGTTNALRVAGSTSTFCARFVPGA